MKHLPAINVDINCRQMGSLILRRCNPDFIWSGLCKHEMVHVSSCLVTVIPVLRFIMSGVCCTLPIDAKTWSFRPRILSPPTDRPRGRVHDTAQNWALPGPVGKYCVASSGIHQCTLSRMGVLHTATQTSKEVQSLRMVPINSKAEYVEWQHDARTVYQSKSVSSWNVVHTYIRARQRALHQFCRKTAGLQRACPKFGRRRVK